MRIFSFLLILFFTSMINSFAFEDSNLLDVYEKFSNPKDSEFNQEVENEYVREKGVSDKKPLPENELIKGYNQIEKEKYQLNYFDLINLSKTEHLEGELLNKLSYQLNTPIILQPGNVKNEFQVTQDGEKYFRALQWNIERGFNVEKIIYILSNKNLDFNKSKDYSSIVEEVNSISKADIIFLNEVDIGLPRTNYENIVEKIAKSLMTGYVFGTEFVEVDPYQLGLKKFSESEKAYLEKEAISQLENIKQEKYLGLHGSAILTKFPIVKSEIIRLPECYNWYKSENEKYSTIEKTRRVTAEKVFATKVLTELRHGSRMAIVADLLLPNKKKITVVGAHFENRCLPECRQKQLNYLLKKIGHINNPLVLAGDFNTTGQDASPTSLQREVLKRVKDPEFVAKQAILLLTPLSIVENLIATSINQIRLHKDPTVKNIPVILPNKEKIFFTTLLEFKFDDELAFDFRGSKEKSYLKKDGDLSDSNEREFKGFKDTFELNRAFGVAKYKLDWFFVKPLNLNSPNDKKGSYAYAPFNGRTLSFANKAFGEKISDHDPIIVDINVED